MSKIASITTGFRLAVDYLNNTGEGIDSNDPVEWEQFFNNTVLRVCPSYKILEDTLIQYPNAVAACVVDSEDVVDVSGSSDSSVESQKGTLLSSESSSSLSVDSHGFLQPVEHTVVVTPRHSAPPINSISLCTPMKAHNLQQNGYGSSSESSSQSSDNDDDNNDEKDGRERVGQELEEVEFNGNNVSIQNNTKKARVTNNTFLVAAAQDTSKLLSPMDTALEIKHKKRELTNGFDGKGKKGKKIKKMLELARPESCENEGYEGTYLAMKTQVLMDTARNDDRRLDMEERLWLMQQKKLENEDVMSKVQHNISVHKARVEAKAREPEVTDTQLENMFPYMTYK